MANKMTSRFPAILLGGPPHAGKSVLSHSLKEALKEASIQCYLLRAAPDGEGDWAQLAHPQVVKKIRRKGEHTAEWVEHICYDIAYRPLPFLVDVGGRPQPWQEAMFDHCTHAILLVKDAESQTFWQALTTKYNLPIIALLTSQLDGPAVLQTEQPMLQGVITQLNRGHKATGPVFEALVARVKALFKYDYDELLTIHQEQAPTDLVVDIPRLLKRLHPDQADLTWRPQDLAEVLDYLPPDTPLALYGIGPVWLYAAIAHYIQPYPFYQFDARRGWVQPVTFNPTAATDGQLTLTAAANPAWLHLKLDIAHDYLLYQPELPLSLPPNSAGQGVILEGKLPTWLYTGLTLFYRTAPWVAVFYPQLNQAIVVASQATTGAPAVGAILPAPQQTAP